MKIPYSNDIFPYKFPTWEETVLSNGVKVYSVSDKSTPLLNFKLIIKLGAYTEKIFGLAYLTTQLMQRGTKSKSADEISSQIDDIGASFSISTGWDEIVINILCISDYQEKALKIALDCLLNPSFLPDEFDKYKKRQLARVEQENSDPEYLVQIAFNKAVFEGSGYSHPIIGTTASINSIQLSDVKEFHEKLLQAEMFIVNSGNFDNEILKLLKSEITVKSVISEEVLPEFYGNKERTIIADKKDASQINLRIGKKTIDRNNTDYHLLSLANTIFGGYFLSRLNKKVREELGLTYGINSYFDNRRLLSSWQISSGINLKSLILTLDTIDSEITSFYEKKIEFEELNIARNYMMGNFLKTLETPHQIASMIATIKILNLKDTYYDDFFRKINYATVDQIYRIQKKFFNSQYLIFAFSGNSADITKELNENFELDLEYI
jgi:zinc protease